MSIPQTIHQYQGENINFIMVDNGELGRNHLNERIQVKTI